MTLFTLFSAPAVKLVAFVDLCECLVLIDDLPMRGTELDTIARCTREEAMRIISGMDDSGDGQIDFDEFLHWWQHAPFAALFV
jgi:hypothetical protein